MSEAPTPLSLDVPGQTQRYPADEFPVPPADPETKIVVEPTMEEAIAALERAIEQRPIFEDDDQAFAAKYQGANVAVLKEALAVVQKRVESEQETIIKDRIAAGNYTESSTRPPIRGKGRGLSTFGLRTERTPSGEFVYKTTEITAEEYPDFNAARMEMWWLVRTLHGK